MKIEAHAYSRLHFGLLEICPGQPHCYGGLGLIIDQPVTHVEAELGGGTPIESLRIEANGYWMPRMVSAVESWRVGHRAETLPVRGLRLLTPPEPHVGLGSGTQLACCVAGLLSVAANPDSMGIANGWFSDVFGDAEALCAVSGRGRRSHIGLHGFLYGGLILDRGEAADGQRDPTPSPSRTESLRFPNDWRIVTACDRSYVGDCGRDEAAIFEACSLRPNPHRDAMLRMVLEELLPAMSAKDWTTASRALGAYGALAGEIFRPLQGGVYRTPSIAEAVAALQRAGVSGVGQSSWGPTVFALARDEEHADWVETQLRAGMLPGTTTRVTRVAGPARYACSSST